MGLPIIGVSTSSFLTSEINEVGGVVGYWRAKFPDDDICSCYAAMSCVMALYVSGTLFVSCAIDDEQGEAISQSSLLR